MKTLTPYELVDSAVDRCKEIKETLDSLGDEGNAREVRGLVLEFQWTVKKIILICDEHLKLDFKDNCEYNPVDKIIKMEQILEQYRIIQQEIDNEE